MSRRVPAGRPPRQTPYKRTYASGSVAWVARYYDFDGRAHYAKPRWNGGKSSFARKGDAQRAIDEALERLRGAPELPETIGGYYEHWLKRYPRSTRTNKTNADRVSYVLEVEIGGGRWGSGSSTSCAAASAFAARPHAAGGRKGGQRSARHPQRLLGDGRGRDRR